MLRLLLVRFTVEALTDVAPSTFESAIVPGEAVGLPESWKLISGPVANGVALSVVPGVASDPTSAHVRAAHVSTLLALAVPATGAAAVTPAGRVRVNCTPATFAVGVASVNPTVTTGPDGLVDMERLSDWAKSPDAKARIRAMRMDE